MATGIKDGFCSNGDGGMLRLQDKTDRYWLMDNYRVMKERKGTGKDIIATARKMSTIVYAILKRREPSDPTRMLPDPEYVQMSGDARHWHYALAV